VHVSDAVRLYRVAIAAATPARATTPSAWRASRCAPSWTAPGAGLEIPVKALGQELREYLERYARSPGW
jgi:hypothetical protein